MYILFNESFPYLFSTFYMMHIINEGRVAKHRKIKFLCYFRPFQSELRLLFFSEIRDLLYSLMYRYLTAIA